MTTVFVFVAFISVVYGEEEKYYRIKFAIHSWFIIFYLTLIFNFHIRIFRFPIIDIAILKKVLTLPFKITLTALRRNVSDNKSIIYVLNCIILLKIHFLTTYTGLNIMLFLI